MKKKMATMLTAALATCLGLAATAEEAAKATGKPEIALKLRIVLSRHQGEKTLASLPYTLSLNSNEPAARLRAGIQVPLKFEGKDFPGNVVYKSVGTELDCSASTLDDGRFRVSCEIELGSVFTVDGEPGVAGSAGIPPILRNFAYRAALTLRDGQTAQYVSAADPLSGEIHKAEITLNVIK